MILESVTQKEETKILRVHRIHVFTQFFNFVGHLTIFNMERTAGTNGKIIKILSQI